MKKLLLVIIALFISATCFAQLEIKPGSFKLVEGFVNINQDKMSDDNDVLYAIIKVGTVNINDKQRHELFFKANAPSQIELEYKVGEVWVYISSTASSLKISHPEFGSLTFDFPFDLEPKKGYEMTLLNTALAESGYGTLVVTTEPENGATIMINGKVFSQKTPYNNDMIAAGKYDVTVVKDGFESVTESVQVKNGETTNLKIEMPYFMYKVNVVSEPAGATVIFDNNECGITPLTIDTVRYGTYEIIVKKKGCFDVKKQIVVGDNDAIRLSFALEVCPVGGICSPFSIGEGKKVCFSKGNYQYQPSTRTSRFAENQWDFIAVDKDERSKRSYKGWIDQFCWGTGDNQISYNSSGRFKDWGENKISNADDCGWRTLSAEEWEYILVKREIKSEMRYAMATVNDIHGIILLPDDWEPATYKLDKADGNYVYTRDSYKTNIISLSVWTDVFEKQGAVFIPAADSHYNSKGYYWTTTKHEKKDCYKTVAMYSDSGRVSYSTPETYIYLCCVRLVHDIK